MSMRKGERTLTRFVRLRALICEDCRAERSRVDSGFECRCTFGSPNKPFDSATLIMNSESNCTISFRFIIARKQPGSNIWLAFSP